MHDLEFSLGRYTIHGPQTIAQLKVRSDLCVQLYQNSHTGVRTNSQKFAVSMVCFVAETIFKSVSRVGVMHIP
jgi:hypothetical protein